MDTATTAPTVVRRVVDDALAAAWDDLADRAGAVPFARPGWLLPWAEAAGVRLEALAAWRGPRLAGVLPVIGERRGLRTPADWHTPWSRPSPRTPALEALAAALAATRLPRSPWTSCSRAKPPPRPQRRRAGGRRLPPGPPPRLESPYLDRRGTWEGYLGFALRPPPQRVAPPRPPLEAAGGVTPRSTTGASDCRPCSTRPSPSRPPAGRAGGARPSPRTRPCAGFYRRVAAWAAERGWLRLAFLRLDGRALAFDLALEAGGRHFLLKTGYDPAFTGLSPGLLLRLHMLERAFAAGLESYEFCGAAEPWKLEWAPATRRVLAIEAFAPTAAGSLARAASGLPVRPGQGAPAQTNPEANAPTQSSCV